MCKSLGISCYTVTETCSKNNEKITFRNTKIGSLGSVHTYHTGIKRILTWESTFTHQCIADRSLDPVSQFADFLVSTGDHTAAAYKNKRFFASLIISSTWSISSLRMFLISRLTVAGWHGSYSYFIPVIPSEHPQEPGQVFRFLQYKMLFLTYLQDLRYSLLIKAVFCHRHYDTCDINLLERISSQEWSYLRLPVMATIGTESMYAVAIPVTRLVAPGPDVARQTPTFPVALA